MKTRIVRTRPTEDRNRDQRMKTRIARARTRPTMRTRPGTTVEPPREMKRIPGMRMGMRTGTRTGAKKLEREREWERESEQGVGTKEREQEQGRERETKNGNKKNENEEEPWGRPQDLHRGHTRTRGATVPKGGAVEHRPRGLQEVEAGRQPPKSSTYASGS